MFQSTRPQGARHRDTRPFPTRPCFNPRARKGRDPLRPTNSPNNAVSIHAPARGATEISLDDVYPDEFQSTRPQGARPALAAKRAAGSKCFNPRARKGRDQGGRRGREAHGVSIHAPARGATCPRKLADALHEFQSTRPQGARLAQELRHYAVYGVSIHAPARGATNIAKTVEQRIKVSIHAPARGATAG